MISGSPVLAPAIPEDVFHEAMQAAAAKAGDRVALTDQPSRWSLSHRDLAGGSSRSPPDSRQQDPARATWARSWRPARFQNRP